MAGSSVTLAQTRRVAPRLEEQAREARLLVAVGPPQRVEASLEAAFLGTRTPRTPLVQVPALVVRSAGGDCSLVSAPPIRFPDDLTTMSHSKTRNDNDAFGGTHWRLTIREPRFEHGYYFHDDNGRSFRQHRRHKCWRCWRYAATPSRRLTLTLDQGLLSDFQNLRLLEAASLVPAQAALVTPTQAVQLLGAYLEAQQLQRGQEHLPRQHPLRLAQTPSALEALSQRTMLRSLQLPIVSAGHPRYAVASSLVLVFSQPATGTGTNSTGV